MQPTYPPDIRSRNYVSSRLGRLQPLRAQSRRHPEVEVRHSRSRETPRLRWGRTGRSTLARMTTTSTRCTERCRRRRENPSPKRPDRQADGFCLSGAARSTQQSNIIANPLNDNWSSRALMSDYVRGCGAGVTNRFEAFGFTVLVRLRALGSSLLVRWNGARWDPRPRKL
jgi:hypothetical protein